MKNLLLTLLTFDGRAVATARHRKTKLGYKLERFAVLEKERKRIWT